MIIQITIQKIVIFIMYITIKPGLNYISVFNFKNYSKLSKLCNNSILCSVYKQSKRIIFDDDDNNSNTVLIIK